MEVWGDVVCVPAIFLFVIVIFFIFITFVSLVSTSIILTVVSSVDPRLVVVTAWQVPRVYNTADDKQTAAARQAPTKT